MNPNEIIDVTFEKLGFFLTRTLLLTIHHIDAHYTHFRAAIKVHSLLNDDEALDIIKDYAPKMAKRLLDIAHSSEDQVVDLLEKLDFLAEKEGEGFYEMVINAYSLTSSAAEALIEIIDDHNLGEGITEEKQEKLSEYLNKALSEYKRIELFFLSSEDN
jgi:hypothetical protein